MELGGEGLIILMANARISIGVIMGYPDQEEHNSTYPAAPKKKMASISQWFSSFGCAFFWSSLVGKVFVSQ